MVAMLMCGVSMLLAVAILISSFHLGGSARRLSIMAAVIAVISLMLAWRVAGFVEASNAIRDDARQVAASNRRVEAELRQLALFSGAHAEGGSEQILTHLLARQADQQLSAQNNVASSTVALEWSHPKPLTKREVLQRLDLIYAARAPGNSVPEGSEGEAVPLLWLNEQLKSYRFDWRLRKDVSGTLVPVAAPTEDSEL